MELIHKQIEFQPEKIELITTAPTPPAYLSASAKKHYKTMAEKLIEQSRLKNVFLNALEIFAEAMAQFEFATKAINEKNREELGSGYIQKFRSGASNITAEITLRNNAETTLFKCFKQFGLDPKSERELKGEIQTGQLDIFTEFLKANG